MPAPTTRSISRRTLALSLVAAALAACAPAPDAAPGASAGPAAQAVAAPPCAPASAAFCWVQPLPQGNTLTGAWLASAGEGWLAGAPGVLLRRDASGLAAVATPGGVTARAVWGSAPDDVWAAGDVLLHRDASGWSVVDGAPAGAWSAVAGAARDDVWVVGAAGAAARFDGQAWTAVDTGTGEDLSAVAVVSPTEAYAATARGGTILRWDGARWAPAARLAAASLASLAAAGPGDVWAAGQAAAGNAAAGARGTALAHLQGGAWSAVTVPGAETATFTAVTAGADGAAWAAGATGAGDGLVARWDGATWTVEPLPRPALPPRALAVRDGVALAAGDGGQLFAREGGAWAPLHHGTPGYLQAAAAAGPGDVWLAAAQADPGAPAALLHVQGARVEAVPVGVADVLYGVAATGPSDVWVGSLRSGLLHWDGARWTAGVGGYAGLVDGVWAAAPDDVWGVAGAEALHWDGASLTRQPLPAGGARRIYGTSSRDVWAFGAVPGVVQRWDGAAWTALAAPGLVLGAWGSGPDDVWLVGEGGLALHWDGRALARVATGTTATLSAIAGTGAGEAWAAGEGGTVVRLAGGAFAPVPSGTSSALAAIAADGAGQLYVAGAFGTVLRLAR